jgi:chromosome partitioning protein
MDLWATGATIELARAEKRPVVLVLNRVAPRGHLGDTIRTLIEQKNLPMAANTLGNRQAFASAVLAGKGVTEFEPGSVAAEEALSLARELERRLMRA